MDGMRVRDRITGIPYDVIDLDLENPDVPGFVCADGLTRPAEGCEMITTESGVDMKLEYMDRIPQIPRGGGRPALVAGMLEEFMASGRDAAKIDCQGRYRDAYHCRQSIDVIIKRKAFACFTVQRNNEVYLVRRDAKC